MPERANPYQPPNSGRQSPVPLAGTITSRVIFTPEHFAETLSRLRSQNNQTLLRIARYSLVFTSLVVGLVAAVSGALRVSFSMLLMAILALTIVRLANYLALKSFSRNPNCNKPLVIVFSNEGVRLEMAQRERMIPWRSWKQAIFFHDGVVIRGNTAYQWIPDDSLESGNSRDSLRSLVSSKMPVKKV